LVFEGIRALILKDEIRIGTRGSLLAMTQSSLVMHELKRKFPKTKFRLVEVRTLGDEYQGVELFKKTNVGVFTKKLEEKLLSGEIDMAVHSLKDMPTDLPKRLAIAAFPEREDTRDCLITKKRLPLQKLRPGAVVGTGSSRRKCQLARVRPDLKLVDLRGNLDTRIGRVVKEGRLDAVVLAGAGLRRTKRYMKYAAWLPLEVLMPAVGQGSLAIETRKNDARSFEMARRLNHAPTEKAVLAERAFLKKLQGGCRVPVGILSTVRSGQISLDAAVFSVKNGDALRVAVQGPASRPEVLGREAAKLLLKKGAARFLKEARE
jgi:hydroxymethylbilane synthase